VKLHLQKALEHFAHALADDLNISSALAALFDMVREVNALCDSHSVSKAEAQETLALLQTFNQVLGFLDFAPAIDGIPQEMQDLLNRRNEARKQKNWALADQLRIEIQEKGYVIEDTPAGARLKKG
jgi:cysteinyl-tRNA synthetase